MESFPKKLITIITEAVIEKELLSVLEQLGASGFTITDARGKGHRGMRSAGWEHGANIRVEIICDDKLASAIALRLKSDFYNDYAMVLFMSDVAVLRPDKF